VARRRAQRLEIREEQARIDRIEGHLADDDELRAEAASGRDLDQESETKSPFQRENVSVSRMATP
jgi:hypothetical protein